MRTAHRLIGVAFLLVGCSSVHVTATVTPSVDFASFRTFKVLDAPARRGSPSSVSNDPMVQNSLTNLALRQRLLKAFTSRGYTLGEANPDFTVAYYASWRDTLITTLYDYGYGYNDRCRGARCTENSSTSQYVQGTVIVDVVNPKTHELAWRGQGVGDPSAPEAFARDLSRTVDAIVKRFPGR